MHTVSSNKDCLFFPDSLVVSLTDCFAKLQLVEKLRPLKVKAETAALALVKPKFSSFYHKGHHLKGLDFNVGERITNSEDLLFTDKASREQYESAYLELFYKYIESDFKACCPYSQAESYYLQSVESLSSEIAILAGVDISDWSIKDKEKIVSLIQKMIIPIF